MYYFHLENMTLLLHLYQLQMHQMYVHVHFLHYLLHIHLNQIIMTAMEAFLSYLRLLGCDVIADNVTNDDQISALVRADCCGYIPSPDYQGSAEHGRLRMPLDEALLQSDDEEDL